MQKTEKTNEAEPNEEYNYFKLNWPHTEVYSARMVAILSRILVKTRIENDGGGGGRERLGRCLIVLST